MVSPLRTSLGLCMGLGLGLTMCAISTKKMNMCVATIPVPRIHIGPALQPQC